VKEISTRVGQSVRKGKTETAKPAAIRNPLDRKQLVVLFDGSPYSYAVVGGSPQGLEYELLQLFAQDQGLELLIKVIQDENHLLDSLRAGVGDLAASNLNPTPQRETIVDFAEPLLTADHRLIQRCCTQNPQRLNGKTVVIRRNSSFKATLLAYAKKHRLVFRIQEASQDLSQEELIERVASGEIDYTVADENVAEAMGTNYPHMEYATRLAEGIPVSWAVNKQSVGLLHTLNEWISRRNHSLEFNMIVQKYTRLSRAEKNKMRNLYQEAKTSSISPYDGLLKEYARGVRWDWRLVAALVYQESKFNPLAISGAGAVGLMQVLPSTAKWLGNKQHSLRSPEANIRIGTQYLQWLRGQWQEFISDEEELIKFTLASYNVGLGHVKDACQLAKKYGFNPHKWEGNVERMLLAKSNAKFYGDPAVQYGYCRGKEPVLYVKNILFYYHHYRNVGL
jgi:membrane-bound lytic murein transglycosylase F